MPERGRQGAPGGDGNDADAEGGSEEAVRAGGGQTEGVDDEGTIASEDGRGPANESSSCVGSSKFDETGGQKAAERISAREHHREGRDRPDGYCETKKRAPKRRREAGERHEFQVVHIARAGRKAMERMASLPRGDG